MERQLVTARVVRELVPIEGADRIELARVDGWQCVVKKGDFKVGDSGLYFEIDSILPSDDERFAFLEQRKFRIKSMKLRGVLSQGLLMPLDATLTRDEKVRMAFGEPLQDILRVQKYEPPVPIAGQQKGTFPTHLVPKTDQERIQNIPDAVAGRNASEFEVTEKLDGTSCTFFCHIEESFYRMGACSRNWEMDLEDDNVYAKLFNELELWDKFRMLERSIAIQGEIIGPGIQGNKYKRGKQEFYVFDAYDIDTQRYLKPEERVDVVRALGLNHIPVMKQHAGSMDLDLLLAVADGQSALNPSTVREGLVFKAYDGSLSFKVISNRFLLKNE